MEPPTTYQLSVFQEHGDKLELLLRKEKERWERNELPQSKLFKHQVYATLAAKDFMLNRAMPKPALVIAPTGSGKSGMIGLIPYCMRSKKTLIITPSPLLSKQIEQSLGYPVTDYNFFEKAGCFLSWDKRQKDNFVPNVLVIENTDEIREKKNELIVVNAQKFGGRALTSLTREDMEPRVEEFFKTFDLLVVDEAHHFPAATWHNINETFKNLNPAGHIIFLTATAQRMIENEYKYILDYRHHAFTVTKEDLEVDVIRPLELVNLNITGLSHPDLCKDLYEKVKKILEKHDKAEPRFQHQALISVERTDAAAQLAQFFNQQKKGFAVNITGGRAACQSIIEKYKDGVFRVAVVCKMLLEGFDNPKISLCVIFKNNRSRVFFEQFLGRCLRRNRILGSPALDHTQAVMLSYMHFGQARYYSTLDLNVTEDIDAHETDSEPESDSELN